MEIYKIENLINGKIYIGQTTKTFNERYNFKGVGAERVYKYLQFRKEKVNNYEKRLYHNNHLLKAIGKYGTENFNVSVIDFAETVEELNEKEMYWINYYDSCANGYNHCFGGGNTTGFKFSEESKKAMSRTRKGMYSGKLNPNYGGILQTEEVRKKMSDAKKGKYLGEENWKSKRVININTLEVFVSVSEASKKYNLSTSNIASVCRREERGTHGTRKTCGGYRWMFYDEYLATGDRLGDVTNKHNKRVRNIDTGEIFNTIAEASRKYNIDNSSLSKACKGKIKTCGGYRWEYYVVRI